MSNLNFHELSPETIKILESMNDGIIITDTESRVLYVNKVFLKLAGVEFKDLDGKILRDVRKGSRLHQALEKREPMINVSRIQDGFESYCDLLPVMEGKELIGGLIVVKDAKLVGEIIREREKTEQKQNYLDNKIKSLHKVKYNFESIIGKNTGMKSTINLAKKAAVTDSNILIAGESGTGKEVLAQSIHDYSSRRNNSFVAVNCAAIPENLWESEFFGYRGGAFSGANKEGKIGLFEVADGGTLFLDEVGEIPMHIQPKLLRVLEERKLRKLGGKDEINIDVRIIAATNKNLIKRMEEGEFRHDLYYRLSVIPIEIPSLKKRKEDVKLFIEEFIEKSNRKYNKNIRIDSDALDLLLSYDWPGNVRELRNTLEYSMNFMDDDTICMDILPINIKKHKEKEEEVKTLKELVEEYEKEIIFKQIKKHGGTLKAKKIIAKKLGISLSSLYSKLNNCSENLE